MKRHFQYRPVLGTSIPIGIILAAAAALVLATGGASSAKLDAASRVARLRASGAPQLVAVERLPEMAGEMCPWQPASAPASSNFALMAALQNEPQHVSADWGTVPPGNADRAPARVIRDTYPTYSAIAKIGRAHV